MLTEKPIGVVLTETKEELKEFFTTRLQILQAEIKEKVNTWKSVLPLAIIAAAMLFAAWITLTFAFIAFLHGLFVPSPYSWLWASLIVGVLYLIVGGALGWFVYGEISAAGMAPKRTLKVLKQDQVWIENEARTA